MTHYAVLVRVPSATPLPKFSDVLTKMMEPWQEHSCTGACPVEFMAFNDLEDEYREEYENESDEFVDIGEAPPGYVKHVGAKRENETEIVVDGRRLVRSWDEMFRVDGSFGTGSNTHKVPDHYPHVQHPYKKLHATFEDFVTSYHGSRGRDPVKGRYGYWENPDHKWDYWRVIRERIPSKTDGMTNFCRISDLDGDTIVQLTRDEADRVWKMIDDVRADRKPPPGRDNAFWDMDARRYAADYGVLKCLMDSEMTPEIEASHRCVKQDRKHDKMVVFDCWDDRIKREDFDRMAVNRCHPLATWARLQRKEGGKGGTEWIESAKMGWWACHGASAEDMQKYGGALIDWLNSGDREDFVIMLDCHT